MDILIALIIILLSPFALIAAFVSIIIIVGLLSTAFTLVVETTKAIQKLIDKWAKAK